MSKNAPTHCRAIEEWCFFYWNEPAAKRSAFGHFGLDVRFFNTAQHLTVVKDV